MSNELTKGGDSRELSKDINIITAEINAYQQVAGEAIFEIGRRLKHVKENDLAHGEWAKWCEEGLNMTPQHANRFIRVYDRFSNRTPVFSLTVSVLEALIPFTDEQLDQEYELPNGEKKKPIDMSRRQIEELKRQLKQAEQEAEAERMERERLERENEELANREPEVITEYIEKETSEPYDRRLDEPYSVERGRSFYEMMNEVDALYKKYAHLKDGIEELSRLAYYDDDMKLKYRKADEFWRMLSGIFNENNDNIIDVEII